MVRTAARDHQRVRHQVERAFDQVAADLWQALQCALGRSVPFLWAAGPVISKKCRPGGLARTEEDAIGVGGGLFGQGGDVQPAQAYIGALAMVMVRQAISAVGVGDVDLDDHQIRLVVQVERLDVLVLQGDLVIFIQITRQGSQPERREERIFDRSPEGAGGFGQSGQYQLDFHTFHLQMGYETSFFQTFRVSKTRKVYATILGVLPGLFHRLKPQLWALRCLTGRGYIRYACQDQGEGA